MRRRLVRGVAALAVAASSLSVAATADPVAAAAPTVGGSTDVVGAGSAAGQAGGSAGLAGANSGAGGASQAGADAAAGVLLTAYGVGSTSATLELHGHSGAWWHQQTLPSEGACTSVAAGASTAALTLPSGAEFVFKAFSDASCATELTDDATDARFTTRGVVLSQSWLIVPEAGSADHTVRLATQPAGDVTVTVTSSGDADVTADADTVSSGSQTTLTFTAANWSVPQTVRLSAAADADATPGDGKGDGSYAQGSTTFTYTATSAADSDYDSLAATLSAEEGDDDVCGGTTAVANAASGGLVNDCNTLLAAKDRIWTAFPAHGTFATAQWDTDTAIGDWEGVTVSTVGGSSRVTQLNLGVDNYGGQRGNVPNTIGSLDALTRLSMWSGGAPTVTGEFPAGITSLTSLTYLVLGNRGLTGPIPSGISSLTSLTYLSLATNRLSGPIPSGIGSLTDLTRLYLYENRLSGTIPEELGSLTKLVSLWVNNNDLTGPVPGTLGSLAKLDAGMGLVAYNNRLSGCVPAALSAAMGANEVNPQRDAAGSSVNLQLCTAGLGVTSGAGAPLSAAAPVAVPEGSTADAAVRLLTEPTASVTVTVSLSGDSDITADTATATAGSQNTLTFTTANWAAPQGVRLAAAADADHEPGAATVTLSAASTDSAYSGAAGTFAAAELDSDAVLGAVDAADTWVQLRLSGHSDWHVRQIGPQGNSACTAMSNTSDVLRRLRPSGSYRLGAYLDAACTALIAEADASTAAERKTVELAVTAVGATSATLGISGHVDSSDTTRAWWYKQTAPVAGDCVSVAAGTPAVSLAALTAGAQYTFKAYSDSGCSASKQLTDDLTDVDFATPGVVLNTDFLIVPEGDTYDHTVRLASEPAGDVTVTITSAGDADLTADTDTVAAGDQTTLTFTAANWDVPRSVRLSAAQDSDTVPQGGRGDGSYAQGTATFTYTAASSDAGYSGRTATLAAYEGDDDVCQGTTAVGGSGVTTGGLVDDCNTLLAAKDTLNGTNNAGRWANNWSTALAIGSWNTITASTVDGAQRVTQLNVQWSIAPAHNGKVANTLGDLTELTALRLTGNTYARGPSAWPAGIENLTKLTEIELYKRRLTGELPANIGNLTNLTLLYVDSNELTGQLPSSIGSLTKLTGLWPTPNPLTGPVPASLGGLTAITSLNLPLSGFTGFIPPEIGKLTKLSSFTLYDNRLTGCVPTSLSAYIGNDKANPQLDPAGNDVWLPLCSAGIAVSDTSAAVAEGGYTDLDVRLWTAPAQSVTVTVTASGDSSVTVDTDTSTAGSQSTLTFTAANWSTPQTMRVSAADDADDAAGTATLAFTASSTDADYSGIGAVALAAEIDDDAVLAVLSRTDNSATLALSGHTSWYYRQDFPQGDDTCRPATAATIALSGLSPGTRYRHGAYLDSLCTDRVDKRTWATERTGGSVSLSASGVTAATATLGISGHVDSSDRTRAWWYKQTAPSDGTCVSVAAGTPTASLSALEDATEYTFKAYSDSGCSAGKQLTDDLTDVDFATPGVVLNTDFLIVPEGDTYDHTVRLASEPAGDVTVTITSAGDADLTADTDTVAAGDQTTLTFTAANWDVPRSVRLSAAQDSDTVPQGGRGDGSYAQGTATFTYTAASSDAGYSGRTATLAAYEGDDDVCQGTTAVGGSGVTTGGLVDDCNTLLAAKDTLNGTNNAGRWANNWSTALAIGSWNTITASTVDGAQRVTQLNVQWSIAPAHNGKVANTLGDLTELTALRLTGNTYARGPSAWPAGIENLTKLTEIELYKRRLTGELPDSLGNLTEMVSLYVDSNELTGALPSSIGRLTKLTGLWGGPNRFSGPIPPELGSLTGLASLFLSHSGLTGLIPPQLGSLTGLNSTNFDISHNRLTGCVPTSLAAYTADNDANPQLDPAGNDVWLPLCSAGIAIADSTGVVGPRVPVGEGGSTDLSVRLWTKPAATVTVEVAAAPSGDSDITVDADTSTAGAQSTLTFTTANWSTPQTVRLSAGQDADDDAGIAMLALRAASTDGSYDGLSEGIVAVESDDEAVLTGSSRTAGTAKLTLSGDGDWWYRRDFPQGDDLCRRAPAATVALSGLGASTVYRFGAYSDAMCRAQIDSTGVGVLLPPPASVTAHRGRHFTTPHGTHFLDVSWPSVTGASTYDVRVSRDNKATWATAAVGVTGTVGADGTVSYRLEHNPSAGVHIDNSAAYVVAVRAVDDYGSSGWAESAAVPVLDDVQQSPSGVAVTRHDGELRVSWTQCDVAQASCSGDTPVTHFAVNVKPADGTWRRAVTLSEYTSGSVVSVTGYRVGNTTVPIDNGEPYVAAVGVYTRWTAVWANAPEAAPLVLPGPPAAVAGTLTGATLRASWSQVSAATGYQVNISGDHKQSWTRAANVSSGATTSADIAVDDPDATYYIAVRSLSGSHLSGWRDSAPITNSIVPPTDVRGYRGFNFVDVEWDAAAGATGYSVQYRARPTASHGWSPWHVSDYTGTTPSYRLNAAPNTMRYQFRVQADHSGAASTWAVSAEVEPVIAHQQPASGVSVVRGDGQLSVSFTHCNWQLPGCAGSTPITHYAVNVLDNGTWRRAKTIPVSSAVVGGATVTITDIDVNDSAANPVVDATPYTVSVGVYTRYWAAWTNHGPIPAHPSG